MKKFIVTLIVFCMVFQAGLIFAAGQLEVLSTTASELGGYPEKPITFVVAYAAGGGTDTLARVIQKGLKDTNAITVPIVVQNIDGGGSLIGMREVLNAKPDGYKFLFHHKTAFIAPVFGDAEFSYKDFKPVAQFGSTPMVYVVHKDSPYNTLMDALKDTANKKLTVGTVPGSTVDVTNAMVINAYGNKDAFILVNSGGGSQRLQLILGKQLDMAPFGLQEYMQYQSQDIKAIAVMDTKRNTLLPNVSTAIEQGINASFTQTHNLLAPKDTPDVIVNFMADAIKKAMDSQEVQDVMAKQTLVLDYVGGPAYATKFFKDGEEIERIVQEVLLK